MPNAQTAKPASTNRIVTPAEAAAAKAAAEAERQKALKAAQPAPAPKPKAPVAPAEPLRDLETLSPSLLSVAQLTKLPDNFNNADSIAWSADGRRLLIDRVRKRFYEVVEVEVPDTVNPGVRLPERVFREGIREASGHAGNPIWIPNRPEQFLMVRQVPGCRDYFASMPFYGWFCNLEIGNSRTGYSNQLTQVDYSVARPRGVASPCISADGTRLFWTAVGSKTKDKAMWGIRQLNLADLKWNGKRPVLSGIQTIGMPTLGTFINSCGASPDGRTFLLSANGVKTPWYSTDLYAWSLATGNLRRLTTGGWNTWASYSPKGYKILWGSSKEQDVINFGSGGSRWQKELRTDLWIMGSDGSDPRRLTFFNRGDSRDAQFLGLSPYDHCFVGKAAWRPGTRQVAVVVYYGGRKVTSSVVLLLDLTDSRVN